LKNIKLVSIFYEVPVLKNNNLFKYNIVNNYRWLKWAPFIYSELKKYNIEVVTSDVAINKLNKSEVLANEIGVIQLMDDKDSLYLIKKGCIPLLLLTFESPVYSIKFYANPKKFISPFKSIHVFSGITKYLKDYNGKINIMNGYGFYDKSEIQKPINWSKRDFMVFVTSNIYPISLSVKYLRHYSTFFIYLKRLFKLISTLKFSQIFDNKSIALSNLRYDSIIYFGQHDLIKIYGRGWDSLNFLPYSYKTNLQKIYNKIKPEICENKITTISNYKFTLCYENARFNGYISEKIIECFVAGSIPIYYGAPDILKFIPKSCFIDYSDFNTLDDLKNYLINISEIEANNYIENARLFLNSESGIKYSFSYFQNSILNSILDILEDKKN
jgi:hypothetical protein